MNTGNFHELQQLQQLQQLKMAWIAAQEVGDTQAQARLLSDHPEARDALADFIIAYAATNGAEIMETKEAKEAKEASELLPLTQRAVQTALGRVFGGQLVAANIAELRAKRGLSLLGAAKGLRLGADVWKKFEMGAIELVSLSERQLERLAAFFEVSAEQFGMILNNSQPRMTLNRRQTGGAARSQQQGPRKQSFAEAIEKSAMSKEEKKFWLGNE